MKRAIIFVALIAIVCTLLAAIAYPHFGLLLVGLAILGVLWKLAGNIVANDKEYEGRE